MKYFLVLERKPNDFMTIDINLIVNTFLDFTKIENIDLFTKNYTKEEILNFIKINNLVTDDYLKGDLKIINENKYRYDLFSKECDLDLNKFIYDNINNKIIMNKFMNIFIKYNKNLPNIIDKIKIAINNKDASSIINIINMLDYLTIRNIYFYINKIKIS